MAGVLNTLLTFAALGTAAYVVVYYLIPQIKANPDLIPSLFPPLLPPAVAAPAPAPAPQQQYYSAPPTAAPAPEVETPADVLAEELLEFNDPTPPPPVEEEDIPSDADIVGELLDAIGGDDPDAAEEEDEEEEEDDDDDDEEKKDSMGISKKKLKEQAEKSKKQQERHEKTLKEMDPKKDTRSKAELAAAQKAAGFYATRRFHPSLDLISSYY